MLHQAAPIYFAQDQGAAICPANGWTELIFLASDASPPIRTRFNTFFSNAKRKYSKKSSMPEGS